MSFTDREIEAIDAISMEYIEQAIEQRGKVEWLSSDERSALCRAMASDEPADVRYQHMLDVIQEPADQLAAVEFLKSRDEHGDVGIT